jgi:hypothetical protein
MSGDAAKADRKAVHGGDADYGVRLAVAASIDGANIGRGVWVIHGAYSLTVSVEPYAGVSARTAPAWGF